jgi:hypothetical protein
VRLTRFRDRDALENSSSLVVQCLVDHLEVPKEEKEKVWSISFGMLSVGR